MPDVLGQFAQNVLVCRMKPLAAMIPEMAEARHVAVGAPADPLLRLDDMKRDSRFR